MKVEVSLGEVVDKVTILRIKNDKINDKNALQNIQKELFALEHSWRNERFPMMQQLPEWRELCATNRALWEVEDALREHESRRCFDAHFVELARSVYRLNDRRAALKRSINLSLGSSFCEEKSYHQ